MATEAPVVGLGANQQDEIGTGQLVAHPAGPAFQRRPLNLLVDLGVDAIGTEAFGQGQHPFPMFWRVVAITDEYPRPL
jgi:hypothetical protein